MGVELQDIVACFGCPIRKQCGGVQNRESLLLSCQLSCGQNCRDNSRGQCVFACPNNLRQLYHELRQVEAFDYLPKIQIAVPEFWHFPLYVPQMHHGYRRKKPLLIESGFAAIAIADILTYAKDVGSALELRQRFRLAKNTKIIALGIAQDHHLERWWNDFDLGNQILKHGDVAAVTVPNFSIFADAPRHQNMISIARLHHFAERLTRENLPVIPHVYAETDEDWERWTKFLTDQRQVRILCVEFQTGLISAEKGIDYIKRLASLQRSLCRPLHVLAVGGAQYVAELENFFETFSVIDSQPFMKTLYRRGVNVIPPLGIEWVKNLTEADQPLDHLLAWNVANYPERLRARMSRNVQHSAAA